MQKSRHNSRFVQDRSTPTIPKAWALHKSVAQCLKSQFAISTRTSGAGATCSPRLAAPDDVVTLERLASNYYRLRIVRHVGFLIERASYFVNRSMLLLLLKRTIFDVSIVFGCKFLKKRSPFWNQKGF
jgi:hypothetical protein